MATPVTYKPFVATNNSDETCTHIEFDPIEFTKPGVYTYTIREISVQSIDGWVGDDREFPVIVTVTEDGEGGLTATPEYPEGFPTFTNVFTKTPARIDINGYIYAVGGAVLPGQFLFGLFCENGNQLATMLNGIPGAPGMEVSVPPSCASPLLGIASLSNIQPTADCLPDNVDPNGLLYLPILTFTATGIYTILLRQLDAPVGVADEKRIVVTVTEAIDGSLVASYDFPDGCPIFRVPAKSVCVTLSACVDPCEILCGLWPMRSFGIFDRCSRWVLSTRGAGRCVRFPPLCLNSPGVYEYVMRELIQSFGRWIAGPIAFPVIIIVTADVMGQLTAEVKFPHGQPIFRRPCNPPANGCCASRGCRTPASICKCCRSSSSCACSASSGNFHGARTRTNGKHTM